MRSKKGYALLLAIGFVIAMVALSIGLYASATYLEREIGIKEAGYINGYYADLSGLRYATIVLRDPVWTQGRGIDGIFETIAHNGETFTFPDNLDRNDSYPLEQAYDNFLTDIGPLGPGNNFWQIHQYSITITEWSQGASWNRDNYQVTASYRY